MAQRIDLPVRKFIEAKLKENFPDFDFRRSTALNDSVANPFAMLIQPFRHELDGIKIAQSLKNYNYISESQADDLLFNLLVFRDPGEKSYGIVRVSFFASGDYQYDTLTFLTSTGLKFFNSSPISISPDTLTQDDDGTFYIDVNCESEGTGSIYAILNGQIIAIAESLSEIARVTNPYRFTQASNKETNFDLFKRAQDAVITRTLLNEYAIRTVLVNEFPYITDLNVVGAGNSAMLRDIVNIDGRNIHTYGMSDIYINTNSVQEDTVDIEYIPDDLTIDVVANTTTETVFPETSDRASGGNCRNLFFSEAVESFSNRSYFNNILRVYSTEFNSETYKDYIIKYRTPQNELVVVNTITASGSNLIKYDGGYINIDGFSSSLSEQYLFNNASVQGSDFSKVVINGANSVYRKNTEYMLSTVTGISANSGECILSSASVSLPALSSGLKLVVTNGDAVGSYDIDSNLTSSGRIVAFGQLKYEEDLAIPASAITQITFSGHMERCVSVGDYAIVLDNNGSTHLRTITAVNYSANSVSFSSLNLVYPSINVKLRDGISGVLNDTDSCYIFKDSPFDETSPSTKACTVVGTYGSGDSLLTYVSISTSDTTYLVGDVASTTGMSAPKLPIVSRPNDKSFVLAGSFSASTIKIYKTRDRNDTTPVVGMPFTMYASGTYDTAINSIVSGNNSFSFSHPNIAVGAPTLSANGMYLVNHTTLGTYAIRSDAISPVLGINGLMFQGTPTMTQGDQWSIVKANSGGYMLGGSTWNDYFSWYGTDGFDAIGYAGTYPNTSSNLQLVIAGGPNMGVYDVTELTNSVTARLSATLSEVSLEIDAPKFFNANYNKGTSYLLTDTVSTSVVVGDTIRITTGLAEGYYRVIARAAASGGYTITISPALSGNVFGLKDAFKVVRDNYQPFFFISNATRFGSEPTETFEVGTPMEPIRRMAEGTRGVFNSTNVTDPYVNFSLNYANTPFAGSTISILDGVMSGQNRTMIQFSDANPRTASFSMSVTNGTYKYEMKQMVQNLNQLEYNIIDNHDYYINKMFVLPVLYIKDISQIDPITGEVLNSLVPNSDFFFYTRSQDYMKLRYSAQEKNIIKFAPQWAQKGMRITYLGDPNITMVDQFVSNKVMRTTNNDMLVKRMESTVVDVYCQAQGISVSDATTAIEQYITTRSSADPVQTSDIISVLYSLGATYVNTETFLFKSYYLPPIYSGNMWVFNPGSRTEVLTPAHSAYIPGIVTVEVING